MPEVPAGKVTARYETLIGLGTLERDAKQANAVSALQVLFDKLRAFDEEKNKVTLRRLFSRQPGLPAPKGLYLWGDVGRGKTMLMDLFFDCLTAGRKRRVHFHAFMQEVHAIIFEIRQDQKGGLIDEDTDPIPLVAKRIAAEAKILCFDEFQITDIADAMIAGRLFEALFELDCVVVATSNSAPGNLYKDGLNRSSFLPFIKLLQSRLAIHHLDAATDYRLQMLANEQVYLCPLGPGADAKIQWLWTRLTGTEHGSAITIKLKGRLLQVPQAARAAARFEFDDLCERPLGPPDFLALSRRFQTVFIEHVPVLGAEKSNAVKRFITLIDTLYDTRKRLVISADAPPESIYARGRLKFEFARTASRLREMQSAQYWSAPGHP